MAAEWILRLGGHVQIKPVQKDSRAATASEWLVNYNFIPSSKFRVLAIDAKGSEVTSVGIEHIKNLESLGSLKLAGCKHVREEAVEVSLPHQ